MADSTQNRKPRVTICLPVAAGATDLKDALKALDPSEAQVAISVAEPDTDAEALCAEAAGDPEGPAVAWSVRPDPVGRAGNLNHLLFHTDTEFALMLPPGALPEAGCIAALLAALDAAPGAVLATADLRAPGRSRQAPRHGASVAGAGPVPRLLAVLSGTDAAGGVCGLIRTTALVPAGRMPEDAPGDALAEVTFAAQLAREGALMRAPGAAFRLTAAPAPGTGGEPALDAWGHHCAAMTAAALTAPASAQEVRLLWLAGVARLLSPSLSAPWLGRAAFTAGQREALLTGFLARMEADTRIDVPWLLDEDWERIRRWTRGFAWSPREKSAITDFGPQPVNAGEGFNPQSGGSAVWVRTEGRLPPGTRVRLGGRTLETETELNTATAVVPPDVTAASAELPLVLVDADGSVRSNQVTFWVLRATKLGRSVVRMLRRLRGQPDPGAKVALPAPKKDG